MLCANVHMHTHTHTHTHTHAHTYTHMYSKTYVNACTWTGATNACYPALPYDSLLLPLHFSTACIHMLLVENGRLDSLSALLPATPLV